MERELWQMGRQLVQMEEKLDPVRQLQQVTDVEARASRGQTALIEARAA